MKSLLHHFSAVKWCSSDAHFVCGEDGEALSHCSVFGLSDRLGWSFQVLFLPSFSPVQH